MGKEDELLDLIKKKFPRQELRIEQLFEENEDFRALCEDYLTCIYSLKKFRRAVGGREMMVDDYEKVLADLEKELYLFIF